MAAPDRYVTDTHSLIWYLTNPSKLGPKAGQAFRKGEQGEAMILVPTIVLAELYYVIERRTPNYDFEQLYATILTSNYFQPVPLEVSLVRDFKKLTAIPEMHDRIIVAVAYREKVPLITRDRQIKSSKLVAVIW